MCCSTFIFFTILGVSLAYLPDPENCCERVKIKGIQKASMSWLDGAKFELEGEYLVYHILSTSVDDARIAY